MLEGSNSVNCSATRTSSSSQMIPPLLVAQGISVENKRLNLLNYSFPKPTNKVLRPHQYVQDPWRHMPVHGHGMDFWKTTKPMTKCMEMPQILLSIFLSSWLFGSAPALPDLFSLAHERGETARLMLSPRQFMLNSH